jgi:hypothetical protein
MKSAYVQARIEQIAKDKLVGLRDVLSRKTRLRVTETDIIEALIEEADIRSLTRYFLMKS